MVPGAVDLRPGSSVRRRSGKSGSTRWLMRTASTQPCDMSLGKSNIDERSDYIELPTGFFTADGVWFHTSEANLREFAGPVIDRLGLYRLFQEATAWNRSPVTLTLLLLAILLHVMSAPAAALFSLGVFFIWSTYHSHVVVLGLVRAFLYVGKPPVQAVIYIVSLSLLGLAGSYLSVLVGLALFILLRWGIVDSVYVRLEKLISGAPSSIPSQDRILRALLLRYAVAGGDSLASTESYETRIMEIWKRGKNR